MELYQKKNLSMIEQQANKVLHFHGPFSFTKGEKSLFHSEFVKSEGIYIWTIKDKKNKINYFHYIGETSSFGKRQREHFVQMTGLNYRIYNPDSASQGIVEIIWNGMWKDRTNDAVGNLIENYNLITNKVINYIKIINVYFAPTSFDREMRKHIEGCIGWNLRNKYKEAKLFYPDDNHIGTKSIGKIGETINIILDEKIFGIDEQLFI